MLEQLSGTVDKVIYYNAESNFSIVQLETKTEKIKVTGAMGKLNNGEKVIVTGNYTMHPTYGKQFKATTCEHQMPETKTDMLAYLKSGVFDTITKDFADQIIERFGINTLDIIGKEPRRLIELGITERRAQQISNEFKKLFNLRKLSNFLQPYGLTLTQVVKIYKHFGSDTQEILEKNPYKLCAKPLLLPIETADKIAQELNIPHDSEDRILASVAYPLYEGLTRGDTCLPADELCAIVQPKLNIENDAFNTALTNILKNDELCLSQKDKAFLALPEFYKAEQNIANKIKNMTNKTKNKKTSLSFVKQIDDTINEIEHTHDISYDSLQRTAIETALLSHVFILTGGPGTGKTTTLNGIIHAIEATGKYVSLIAPTGRAAKRLENITNRKASTIHRLLEPVSDNDEKNESKTFFQKNEINKIKTNVIIVDEMSMVDVLLFDALLKATKDSTKLILVGDHNQLPSVGAGNVLKNLLDDKRINHIELTKVFRQADESLIIHNAHNILDGKPLILNDTTNDFFFIPKTTATGTADAIIDLMVNRLPQTYQYNPLEDIQVLCPERKGPVGIQEINKMIQAKINPKTQAAPFFKSNIYHFYEKDKVMQTKNNYDVVWDDPLKKEHIFNGEVGIIQRILQDEKKLLIDFDGSFVWYDFTTAREQLELAYAMTIHKSQGNEFKAVIMPIFDGYDRLYCRNLLYTGVTRAKKQLILIGQESRIRFMVNNNITTNRFTNLTHFLEN